MRTDGTQCANRARIAGGARLFVDPGNDKRAEGNLSRAARPYAAESLDGRRSVLRVFRFRPPFAESQTDQVEKRPSRQNFCPRFELREGCGQEIVVYSRTYVHIAVRYALTLPSGSSSLPAYVTEILRSRQQKFAAQRPGGLEHG